MSAPIRLLVVSLAGCVWPLSSFAEVPYPDDWPKVITPPNGACSSITGRYEYHGEAARRPTPFPTVNFDNSAFNRMSLRGQPRAALVTHDLESGKVTITIEGENLSQPHPEGAVFSRQLKCEGGWSIRFVEAPGVRYEGRYAIAEDGSLIVQSASMREHKPMFGQTDTLRGEWLYRFKKVSNAQ